MDQRLAGDTLPPRLFDLKTPPAELWLRGALDLAAPAVALVGARHPTELAREWTHRTAGDLARRGVVVISGGALGIDGAAHRGALDAGGRTVVVAPAGWDHPYPREHRELFSEVVEAGGGYLSLVRPEVGVQRGAFHRRNGTLAALTHVIVVVQAAVESGARNAAAHARRLGRPVLALGYPPWEPEGAGNVVELRLGAVAVGGVPDVLTALAGAGHPGLRPAPERSQLALPGLDGPPDPLVDRVVAALERGARTADELVLALGQPVAAVRRVLLDLTLSGRLREHSAGGLELSSPRND